MARPSPWRASAGAFALSVVVGVGFVVLIWRGGGNLAAGVFAGASSLLVVSLGELQAQYRLSHVLGEFAGQVPGEPEAESSWSGDQAVRWPDLGLAASGWTHRFTLRGLEVEVDDRVRYESVRRPREAARAALADRDRRPTGSRLPSVYPRLSALRVGPPVVLGGAVLLVFGLALGPVVRTVGATVLVGGLVLGVGRWAGLVRTRTGLASFAEGLEAGGVEVEHVDLVGGVFAPGFEVVTGSGRVPVRCVAHPWGRLRVTVGDRTVEGRLHDGEAVGREVAALVRETPTAGRSTPAWRLLTARHFLFGGLAAVFGAMAVGAFGVALSGPGGCDADCLLVGLLGLLSLAFAVGLGGIAAGLLPGSERVLRQ